jgi:hypothetical protein
LGSTEAPYYGTFWERSLAYFGGCCFFLQFQNIHSGCQLELQNIRALLFLGFAWLPRGWGGGGWECYGICFFAL